MHRCPRLGSPHPLPSVSWECRCNIKHQLTLETSYLVMETHANSTPIQPGATCMCLPKDKAKKHGHCQKKLAKALDDYLAKGDCLEDIFSTNPQEVSTLCIYPRTPEQHKECVNQQNTVSHNSCPIFFILPLMRNIPLTTMAFIVFCFGKRAMLPRNASTFIQTGPTG